MYRIYTTSGIVLKRYAVGEANLVLKVLTADLGLISVSVQSSRSEKSKLRSSIQDFSMFQMSVVKGKNGWRMTSAISQKNLFFDCPEYGRKTLAQIGAVVLKLIPGESHNSEIFDLLKGGFLYLAEVPSEDLHFFESLIMLRFLNLLGYVAKDAVSEEFLETPLRWDNGLLKSISQNKIQIIEKINKAISASQL